MKINTKVRVAESIVSMAGSIAVLFAATLVASRAQAQAAPSTFLGTVTAISSSSLTVKTDAGDVRQVQVPATTTIKRVAPEQKDLSTAETIQFNDLTTGDRVLIKLNPNAAAGASEAVQVITLKQADLAQLQQKERDDWQLRGLGGLVKSVDTAGGVITLTSGMGATAKAITVHTTPATVFKRYAPASVSYDAAKLAPIDTIHAGDQLRARGGRNADGTDIAAVEVISGTFRNISGTIQSLDAASSTLVVKDLTTKKRMNIHISANTQMRKLSDTTARMLTARLTGGAAGPGGGRAQGGVQAGDPQQILSRAPAIQLADLKKDDAVMLVSTDGATDVTAIMLMAGVEPLLEAPAATQSLLNNWSLSSGGGAEN